MTSLLLSQSWTGKPAYPSDHFSRRRSTFDILLSDLDVPEYLMGTPEGGLLMNFFLESHVENVRETGREAILAFIGEDCRRVNGCDFHFNWSGIFLLK
jgi:hypothetical protein